MIATIMVIGVGLLWRSSWVVLPAWLSNNGGDALWAMMIFFGFGIIFTKISTVKLFFWSLAFSWCVEFSQLYHAEWIDKIRITIPGRLVLGSIYYWPDLIAYSVGIGIAVLLECRLLNRLRNDI